MRSWGGGVSSSVVPSVVSIVQRPSAGVPTTTLALGATQILAAPGGVTQTSRATSAPSRFKLGFASLETEAPPLANVNGPRPPRVCSPQTAEAPFSWFKAVTFPGLLPVEFPRAGFASSAVTLKVVSWATCTVREPCDATGPSLQLAGGGTARKEAAPVTCHSSSTEPLGQASGGDAVKELTPVCGPHAEASTDAIAPAKNALLLAHELMSISPWVLFRS